MFKASSNLLSKSGLTAEEIDKLLTGKGVLAGLGDAFAAAEKKYGINAYFGIAQAAEETGWGTSPIATQKHNIFGITAYDENPYGFATTFDSPAECVEYWANFLKTQYLTPGGAYYVNPTPAGVARHWASDPAYATKLVNLMNQLVQRAAQEKPPIVPEHGPVPNNAAAKTYTVKRGDNMWQIAHDNGLTLSQLESMNPHAGHPAGNFSVIWPNDVLALAVPNFSKEKQKSEEKE